MEVETMLDDDHQTIQRIKQRRKNIFRSNKFRLGLVFLALGLIAVVASFGIVKSIPHNKKIKMVQQEQQENKDTGETFRLLFSSTFYQKDENVLLNIENINDVANQLNEKLEEEKIRVIDMKILKDQHSKKIRCQNPLNGSILQLKFISLCDSDDSLCSNQVRQKIRESFNKMSTIPLRIQFENSEMEDIEIKICKSKQINNEENNYSLNDVENEQEKKISAAGEVVPKMTQNVRLNINNPYRVLRKPQCALCINKIGLVQMSGEFGTRISDDIRIIFNGNENAQTVSLYENSNAILNVQFDCGSFYGGDPADSPCSKSLSIIAWIDFNDNQYDDSESRMLRPNWSSNERSTGSYSLDVYIPPIDQQSVRAGNHRLRLTVVPSNDYLRECGNFGYEEIREYTVNIVPRIRTTIPTTTSNPICLINNVKLILVLMAGEKGTEIRDDRITNNLALSNGNDHHLSIKLYENTVYLLRIQLDCSTQLKTKLTTTGCNLAQDVHASIDLNNDGKFDENESATPYRWPVTSYLPEGIYDLQIYIPRINEIYSSNRQHRMKLNIFPTDYYRQHCGLHGYSETREYSVQFIARDSYSVSIDVTPPSGLSNSYECSPSIGKIVLVLMAGEHRTQIRDDSLTQSLLGNNPSKEHLSIILYEGTTYLLRLQIECDQLNTQDQRNVKCQLPYDFNLFIDYNDDGVFSENESAAPYRWPITSYTPKGVYDLQISVPFIDQYKVKSGPHRARLAVKLNPQYAKRCSFDGYQQFRDYTFTIVKTSKQTAELNVPYIKLTQSVCSQTNGQIVLVIMAGEKGTEIRDDTLSMASIQKNQNRHHMGVSVYENTIYRIRIQLDCDQNLVLPVTNRQCNLAQDVNVLFDLNNDGNFDESESRTPNRWPLPSSIRLGIYDYEIFIPSIDFNVPNQTFQMRILVSTSSEQKKLCGNDDFAERRDYTVNVIRKY